MWVAQSAGGLGIGRRLFTELENRAAADGARVVRLETNKTLTVEHLGTATQARPRQTECSPGGAISSAGRDSVRVSETWSGG
jgi:GNAT superfamily N-acetyltransferase